MPRFIFEDDDTQEVIVKGFKEGRPSDDDEDAKER